MRALCYVIFIAGSLVFIILPWFIGGVTWHDFVFAGLGVVFLIVGILGLVKGWRCLMIQGQATITPGQ